VFQTSRLRLRPAGEPDIEPLHRLWTEPGVRRVLWDDEVIPLDRARAVVLACLETCVQRSAALVSG
jgi:RimJ/RimL family protein N-acetyltransferase